MRLNVAFCVRSVDTQSLASLLTPPLSREVAEFAHSEIVPHVGVRGNVRAVAALVMTNYNREGN